jgi:cytochrome c oxidase subunit 2
MKRKGWKSWWIEAWALVAVAVIAFVAGLLIGDLGGSPETKTVYVSSTSEEEVGEVEGGGEAEAEEAAGGEAEPEGAANSPGGQVFTNAGCGTCHTLAAAGSTGETGPDLNEFLAPDDDTAGIEVMIANPNSELAEGYPANVMPQNYGETLSKQEVHQLAEFLVATTPAKP